MEQSPSSYGKHKDEWDYFMVQLRIHNSSWAPITGAAQTKNYYDIGGECWRKEVANERNLDDIFRKGNIWNQSWSKIRALTDIVQEGRKKHFQEVIADLTVTRPKWEIRDV